MGIVSHVLLCLFGPIRETRLCVHHATTREITTTISRLSASPARWLWMRRINATHPIARAALPAPNVPSVGLGCGAPTHRRNMKRDGRNHGLRFFGTT